METRHRESLGHEIVNELLRSFLPVDELIEKNQITGGDFLLQRAAGGRHEQVSATNLLQSINVGSVIDFSRHDAVVPSVSKYMERK